VNKIFNVHKIKFKAMSRRFTSLRELVAKLQERPCSKRELVEAVSKSARSIGAARKRVERGLKLLCELGLVREEGGHYYWYIYPNLFTDYRELESRRLHSKQLIPGLKALAGLWAAGSVTDEGEKFMPDDLLRLLRDCAEEHLKTYPDIWKTLHEHRECVREAEKVRKELERELERRLEAETKLKPMEYFPGTESFVSSTVPSLISYHIEHKFSQGTSRFFEYRGAELWFDGYLVARGTHLHNVVRGFIERQVEDQNVRERVRHAKEKSEEAYRQLQELQEHIRRLILRIRGGEPLKGRCQTCPEVYFKPQIEKAVT
jgi:hypothetical protein